MKLFCFSWEGPLTHAQAIVCDETLVKAKKTLFKFLVSESYNGCLSDREKKADIVKEVNLYVKHNTDVSKPDVIAYYDGGD
jgi:hypothetical protein